MKRHGYTEQELRAMPQPKLEMIVQALTGSKKNTNEDGSRRVVSTRRRRKSV